MHIASVVGLSLGMVAAAFAQDPTLDDSRLPASLAAELKPGNLDPEQDQKKQEDFTVTATTLRDDQKDGPYKQPVYTEHRPVPSLRIYLQTLPGGAEFEQWAEIRVPRHQTSNGPFTEVRFQEEFEFGLGNRLQLDMYARETYFAQGPNSTLTIRGWSGEVRYALADWGEIWGNPTLYFEYIVWNSAAPAADADPASSNIEVKVLLGDEISPGWYWGLNLSHERTLGGRSVSVYENVADATVMHTVVDGLFSAGVAVEGVYEADRDYRPGGFGYMRTRELYIGPAFQLRMAYREQDSTVTENGVQKTMKVRKPRAHLDVEPLVGIGPESFQVKMFIVFGWDF